MNSIPKPQQSKGFTLIEIIVTVAIIGIVVAFVGVNISRDTDRLARLEAKRFHAIVNEVRDEAIISGVNYVMSVNTRGLSYGFDSLGQPLSSADDGLLRKRSLQAGVNIEWEVFDQLQNSDEQSVEQEGLGEPQVLISPLGEITPFDIGFVGSDNRYHVFVNDEYVLEQRIEEKRF